MNPLTTADISPGDSSSDFRVAPPPPCVACGAYHGAVNAEIGCLRRAVVALRTELAGPRAALQAMPRKGTGNAARANARERVGGSEPREREAEPRRPIPKGAP